MSWGILDSLCVSAFVFICLCVSYAVVDAIERHPMPLPIDTEPDTLYVDLAIDVDLFVAYDACRLRHSACIVMKEHASTQEVNALNLLRANVISIWEGASATFVAHGTFRTHIIVGADTFVLCVHANRDDFSDTTEELLFYSGAYGADLGVVQQGVWIPVVSIEVARGNKEGKHVAE